MPITFDIDEAANVVRVRVTGAVTEEELLAYQSTLMTDGRVRPGFRLLFDATLAIPDHISSETIDRIVELDTAFRNTCPGRRTAIVVPSSVGYELARRFEKRAQPDVMVFCNLDVAKTWLGLD